MVLISSVLYVIAVKVNVNTESNKKIKRKYMMICCHHFCFDKDEFSVLKV